MAGLQAFLRRAMAGAGIVAAAAWLAACGDARASETATLWDLPEGETLRRRVTAERWDTLWTVGGELNDTLLLRPLHLQAAPGGVYLFDMIAQRLLAFGADGRLRWTLGRKGKGPDEFTNVRDVAVGPADSVWLLDPENARLSVAAPDGRIARRVPLAAVGAHAEQLVPLAGGWALLFTDRADSAIAVVDAAGEVVERRTMPWDGFARLHFIVRQGFTAAEPGGDAWAYGFVLGDGWFPFRGAEALPDTGRYAEHQPFPVTQTLRGPSGEGIRLKGYAPCTACALALDGGVLHVLFGGYTERSRRLVDRFRWPGGEYLDTWLLPERAVAVAARGDTLYAVVSDAYPTLLALRPAARR